MTILHYHVIIYHTRNGCVGVFEINNYNKSEEY